MLPYAATLRLAVTIVLVPAAVGSPTSFAQSSANLASRSYIRQSMNKSNATKVTNVLVKSPKGINRPDSGASFPVEQGVSYRIKVEYKGKDGNTFPRDRFSIRKAFLYEWVGQEGQKCSNSICWSNLRQFSSLGNPQQEDIRVEKTTRWLISSWHTGFPNGMTLQVDYPDCPASDCWMVEELTEGGKKGLRLLFKYEPADIQNRSQQLRENLRTSAPGTTIITIIPIS